MRVVDWMNFETELEQKTAKVEAVLRRYLPAETGYQRRVAEAMNYSIQAGGKRLREGFEPPTLCL